MDSVILPIFGPLAIHTFGVCIALGVLTALILATRNTLVKNNHLLEKHLLSLVNITVVSGIIGGRLLYVITAPEEFNSWLEMLAIWNGGLSVLGAILCSLITLFMYMHILKLPPLLAFDILGLYAPLVQAFGRIGCFYAGCCHGTPSDHFFSVTYTNSSSVAPLCVALHPTQLYNSIALFIIFVWLNWYSQSSKRLPGELILFSLFGISFVRFITDYWRGDRGILLTTIVGNISLYQLFCLGFMIPAFLLWCGIKIQNKRAKKRVTDVSRSE